MSERVVLITGANQGLGLEMVKKLACENANYCILLGSRDLNKGKKAASEIMDVANNTSVDVLQLDVGSDDSIAAAVKTVEAKYGYLDVLVNNAGISKSNAKSLRQQMLDVFETNVASVAMVTDAFAPLLKKSKSPRIIILSSDLGSISNTLDPKYAFYGYPNKPYKTSKAAANMLGAVYSVEYAEQGFIVNMVNPGFRQTNMNGYHEAAGKKEDGALEVCRLIKLGAQGETGTYTEIEGPLRW